MPNFYHKNFTKMAKTIFCFLKFYDKRFFHNMNLYDNHFSTIKNTKVFVLSFWVSSETFIKGFWHNNIPRVLVVEKKFGG